MLSLDIKKLKMEQGQTFEVLPKNQGVRYLIISDDGRLFNPFTKTYHNIFELSNEDELKIGDLCYDSVLNEIFEVDKYYDLEYLNHNGSVLKIIATTDKHFYGVKSVRSRINDVEYETLVGKGYNVQQIPRSTLESYVKEYNKDVKTALVEFACNVYDEYYENTDVSFREMAEAMSEEFLKLRLTL